MNRPKIKIKKSILAKSIEISTFLLILGSAILLGIYYSQLPEQLPIHFNWPSKDSNGLVAKNVLWASPIICGILVLGIYKLNQYPWIFNYPTEINQDNAEYNYKQAMQLLRVINLLIALLCLWVTISSILDGLDIENKWNTYLEPLFPILLIGIPIIYAIRIATNKKIKA